MAIQGCSFLTHFLLQLLHKDLGIRGQLEGRVVGLPLDDKIGGDIFIRIAIPISANHPDLLATQPLTQCLQDAEFITFNG
jgi:hypothetical protein